jgi:hypothetical protein
MAHLILGFTDADTGQRDAAAHHFRAALAASTLGPILAGPIEGIAQLASTRDPERALRLLAAATALRERQAVLRPPVIRQRFAKTKTVSEVHLDQLPSSEHGSKASA